MQTLWLSWPCIPLLPGERAQEPAVRRKAVEQSILPADPASPVLGDGAGTAAAKCAKCGKPFQPRTSGQAKRFCSARCRIAHHSRARRRRQGNGAIAEPVPSEIERPFIGRQLDDASSDPAALAVPGMPWEVGEQP
jgi:hypothetical protein